VDETDAVRAVMEADRWIDRVGAQMTHLPELKELATLEADLRTQLADLTAAEASLAPVRQALHDAANESERLRARAGDLEATLSASTANARELTALQGEVGHVKELLARSEDRELELLVDVEPLELRVSEIRQHAQPGVRRRGELREAVAQLHASLEEELISLRAARAPLADRLSPAIRARYDAALTRAGTSGAAQVVEGRCDGCRLALSPLDLDHFKAQPPGTFMDCPECGRLLLP
jgi:predicted  nucleic acid-binding Zn-ribbon protein